MPIEWSAKMPPPPGHREWPLTCPRTAPRTPARCRSQGRDHGRGPSLRHALPSWAAAEGNLFLADADGKDDGVEGGEDERKHDEAKGERENKNLAGNDQIVRMPHEPIRSSPHQRRTRKHDDACGPPLPERDQDPGSARLQQ